MKPIIFNTEMVQAILEGRKTVTRRKIKLDLRLADTDKNDNSYLYIPDKDGDIHHAIEYCKYKPGDILYVRETWQEMSDNEGDYIYKANGNNGLLDIGFVSIPVKSIKWRSSIHMPKKAARIFLKVTDVRVERVQDIMKDWSNFGKEGIIEEHGFRSEMHRDFIEIWNNIYGDWEENPFVWVIEFEKLEGSM